MYLLQDAHSFWAFLYFVPLILFGSYFLVNLCLACITIQLARSQYLYFTQTKGPEKLSPSTKAAMYFRAMFSKLAHSAWQNIQMTIQKFEESCKKKAKEVVEEEELDEMLDKVEAEEQHPQQHQNAMRSISLSVKRTKLRVDRHSQSLFSLNFENEFPDKIDKASTDDSGSFVTISNDADNDDEFFDANDAEDQRRMKIR